MNHSKSGFTLVELLTVIAVLSILIGWAIPSFSSLLQDNRLVAASNQLTGLLNHARSEALRRGDRVWVSPAEDKDGVADWDTGAVIWQDRNGDGVRGSEELIRLVMLTSADLDVTGTGALPFGFDGMGFSVAEQAYALQLCARDSGRAGQLIEINGGGHIQVTDAVNC